MPVFFLLSFVLIPLSFHRQIGWILAVDGSLTVSTSPIHMAHLSLHQHTDKLILNVWRRAIFYFLFFLNPVFFELKAVASGLFLCLVSGNLM